MTPEIKIKNVNGIINTGQGSYNSININTGQNIEDIKWDVLMNEIDALKSSSDPSLRKFSNEAKNAAQNKDKRGFLQVLTKWIPCIGTLIESSYYIIEIAKNFNIHIG